MRCPPFTEAEVALLVELAASSGVTLNQAELKRLAPRRFRRALRAVGDTCRIIRAGRGDGFELSFALALRRLEAAGGDAGLATRRMLWSMEHRPGMQEALQHIDQFGIDLQPATIYERVRQRGLADTLRYIEALAALMDHAVALGLRCSQTLATSRLSRAGGDLDAALADFDAERARRDARLYSACRLRGVPRGLKERANAFAICGCRSCVQRLAQQLQPYIGKMIAAPFFSDLDPEEARAMANEELINSVDAWDRAGSNFAGWFSARFTTIVRSVYAAKRVEERSLVSLDAAGVLEYDGDGREVPLGERIPDRTVDVADIVILRERVAAKALQTREARAERAAEHRLDGADDTESDAA